MLKNNQFKTILLISGGVILFMFALSGWAVFQIPADAKIPVHWGIDGQPDRYGGRFEGLFLMPLIMTAVVALLAVVPKIEPRRFNLDQSIKPYRAVWLGLLLFFGLLHTALVISALGRAVPISLIISAGLGLLFMVIGNYMGKVRSNFMFGIRTPWTLASDLSWDKTHRLGGKLFMAAGGAILLAGLFATPTFAFQVMMVGTLGTVIVTFVYSYLIWRQDPAVQQTRQG